MRTRRTRAGGHRFFWARSAVRVTGDSGTVRRDRVVWGSEKTSPAADPLDRRSGQGSVRDYCPSDPLGDSGDVVDLACRDSHREVIGLLVGEGELVAIDAEEGDHPR